MSYCKECEQAIASFQSMVHIGLMEDSSETPREQAETLAYDKGYTCASKGKECEDNFLNTHFQVIHIGDKA